jgi:hypothetical protein
MPSNSGYIVALAGLSALFEIIGTGTQIRSTDPTVMQGPDPFVSLLLHAPAS